ncbi:hypothetical protein AB0H71_12100 [Nocardia sp. NPDC050697]|uniref:DUF7373 family lipoprotein n=1 Tax=Nocardia sp. NPDC050697 TaxID=3155158 RepID=UPI0033D00BA0
MAHRPRLRLVAVVLGTLALITGCTKTDGHPTAAEIDVRTLDVGNYPTSPLEFRYSYDHGLVGGEQLAAMRLADHMVLGTEVDPDFHYLAGSDALLDRHDIEAVFANVNGPVIERHNPVVGFAITLSDKPAGQDGKETTATRATVAVVQFADAATAELAVKEAEATDFAVAADINQPVSIPNIPTARAHWRPGVPTLGAMQAHGAYLISAFIERPKPDLGILADLARRALENQGRLLDELPPIDGEGMLRLDNDPEGMLNRTLNPTATGLPSFSGQATFLRRGMLTRANAQYDRAAILDKAGVDAFSYSGAGSGSTQLFRARDAAGAEGLGPSVLEWGTYTGQVDAPEAVPGVRCGARTAERVVTLRYRCVVPYHRYLASVESDQIVDLHQRAAAQYALLANTY